MRNSFLVLIIALVAAAPALAETPKAKLALKGLDPIALAEGKEVAGKESIEAAFGLFQYRFASEENKAKFLKDPEAHGIQFGGACGKMGPFSGMGSPERFLVFDKRIYVFASDGCRESFKRAPKEFIELPNPAPTGTEEEMALGKAYVELALRGFGGKEKVDGLKTLEVLESHTYLQGGKEYVYPHRLTMRFPLEVRVEDDFGSLYGFVVSGDKAAQFEKTDQWLLEPLVRDVARRQVLRYPLVMLKNRDSKDFVAIGRKDPPGGDAATIALDVSLHGATSRWRIEPKSGRVISVQFDARRGINGKNRVDYSDFKEVDGLVLPHSRKIYFNEKEVTSPEIRLEKYVIDRPIEDSQFIAKESNGGAK